MKSLCPHCRRELNLMEIFHESDTTAIIGMLPSFGKHAHVVMGYCYLFGVSPWRLKAKKLRILLTELKTLFDSESFSYQKHAYRISQAGIAEALNMVVKKNFAEPLDSHNYLKKVMLSISAREDKAAGRETEKGLRKRETALMSGSRSVNGDTLPQGVPINETYPIPEEQVLPPPVKIKTMPEAHLSDEQIEANRRHIKTLLKDIGG